MPVRNLNRIGPIDRLTQDRMDVVPLASNTNQLVVKNHGLSWMQTSVELNSTTGLSTKLMARGRALLCQPLALL